jgi:hypothetical protein
MNFDAGTLAALGIISTAITVLVELIKAWIPAKWKDDDGLVFKTKKKKKVIHIPNAAIWPTISLLLGISIFLVLKFNLLQIGSTGDPLAEAASATVSGAATTLGSSAAYRVKNLASAITTSGNIGSEAGSTVSAQSTGPSSNPLDTILASVQFEEATVEATPAETSSVAETTLP